MTFDHNLALGLISIARLAGRQHIIPYYRHISTADVSSKTDCFDLVTRADRTAEAFLTERISAMLPDWTVVGEEACAHDPSLQDAIGRNGTVVVVDPIDGTENFVDGLSVFGIILAVVQDGETQFGLLYDPLMDDWIYAIKGQGAHFVHSDGVRSRCRISPPPRADLQKGFVAFSMFAEDEQRSLLRGVPQFGKVTQLRCCCHEYRQSALGRYHFSLNKDLNPWDHAAGALIVEEAGGVARLLTGERYRPGMVAGNIVLCANDDHFQKLRDAFPLFNPPTPTGDGQISQPEQPSRSEVLAAEGP